MTRGRWGKLRRLEPLCLRLPAATTPASQFSPSMQAGMENGFIDGGVFHSSAAGGDLAAHASLTGRGTSTADPSSVTNGCASICAGLKPASGASGGERGWVGGWWGVGVGSGRGGAAAFGIKYSLLYPPQGCQETSVWGRTRGRVSLSSRRPQKRLDGKWESWRRDTFTSHLGPGTARSSPNTCSVFDKELFGSFCEPLLFCMPLTWPGIG